MSFEVRSQTLSSSQLIRDYYHAAPALAPFFNGSPWDPEAVRRLAGAVNAEFDADSRRAMRAALSATTPTASAKADRIANGEGFFVLTGQQAGLFTGPLYTIYKTVTAIRTAAAYEELLGVPVAPLFWIAADDHDFAEINHALLIGADNDIHRVEIAAYDDVQRSMALQPLPDNIASCIDALAAILPTGEFSQQVVDWTRESYSPGDTIAGAFGKLLARIFAAHDLLITSSSHPVVKKLGAAVIQRELDNAATHEAAIREQTDRLVAAGYHEQVTIRTGAANVLYEDESGRDRLVHEDGDWSLSRSKRRFSSAEISQLITERPQRFSANVHLRPVVSSTVFPTLAYVGGPAEVGYYAQIRSLFDLHGIEMPLVVPRASFEIIEYKVQKVLDKFGLTPDDLHVPFDQLASQVIRDELPDSVTSTVQTLREQIADRYAMLVEATKDIDPTLKGPLENARNASHKALADAEKKIVSHLKKKNEIGIEQLRKASANLYPGGKAQERGLNVLSYLARHGPGFIDAVLAEATSWR